MPMPIPLCCLGGVVAQARVTGGGGGGGGEDVGEGPGDVIDVGLREAREGDAVNVCVGYAVGGVGEGVSGGSD